MRSLVRPASRRFTPELLATIILVIAYIVWILSMPAWPSQDGPIHLYYVHVLGELLSNSHTVYSRYYTIKHLLPPYALYYYLLLGLSKFCSLLLADRIVLCLYFVLFVFGFRYSAVKIGPSADLATLLAVVLALNWSAGMGFLNYCLSLALVFWAIGLWLRFTEKSFAARIIFLLLVAAITLTHPVPLIILLAFCGVDWVQRILFRSPAGESCTRNWFKADLAVLAIAALALVYVRHFATASSASQPPSIAGTYLARVATHTRDTILLHHLALILGHSPATLVYGVGLLAVLLVAFILCLLQRGRNRAARQWTPGDTWLIYAVIILVVIPFLPSDLNDAFYFTERLSILVWLAPLVAMSGWNPPASDRRRYFETVRIALVMFAVVINVALLWESNRILRPIAEEMAAARRTPVSEYGKLGLILESSPVPVSAGAVPSWNPFYWGGAHVFRHNDAVLDNSPWLDAAIIPLGAQPALAIAAKSTGNDVSPHNLSAQLESSAAARTRALDSVDFVLITDPSSTGSPAVNSLLTSASDGNDWQCRRGAPWFQLCEPVSTH